MKTPLSFLPSGFRPGFLLLLGGLALAPAAEAKDHHKKGHHDDHSDHHDRDHDRTVYLGRPRSSFTLSFGSGYAGNGYYYGPPNAAYYYERPGVTYYRTRAVVPREYYSSPGYVAAGPGYYSGGRSEAARCQSALARRGYYNGPIDGDIGPGSRAAIRQYQLRQGLTVTGYVDRGLLISLGIR